MCKFTDFAGTPLQESVIPIIPIGVNLSPHSKLVPERLGKIPGCKYPEGWGGFGKTSPWQKIRATPRLLETWDRWYEEDGREPIIGLHTRLFPAIDIDVEDKGYADTITKLVDRI